MTPTPPDRPYQPYIQPRPQQRPWGQGHGGRRQPPQRPYGDYPQHYDGYPPGDGYGHQAAVDLLLAPIYRRAGARLIDSVVVWAFGFAVVFPIVLGALGAGGGKNGGETPWTSSLLITFFIIACVLPFLLEATMLMIGGQSLGKRFLGLRVVSADPAGAPITLPKAVWRAAINNIGYQLPIFFFLLIGVTIFEYALAGMFFASVGVLMSYLWAIWDQPLHQAIHDRFGGTVVVDDREYDDGEE